MEEIKKNAKAISRLNFLVRFKYWFNFRVNY